MKRRAWKKLLQSVEAGHTFSYNAIGGFYLGGEHVGENVDRAVYYFNRSAARDDIYGYLNVGTLYRDGKGVPQDYEAALGWFKKAHEGGHPAAGTAIGLLYYNGQGVEKDPEEATRWFRESAQRGDAWGPLTRPSCWARNQGKPRAATGSGCWPWLWPSTRPLRLPNRAGMPSARRTEGSRARFCSRLLPTSAMNRGR
ncbi:tetratricopeptide repeat protein [Roseibium salinum]|nr:tetratricopeptide repeat protein [Roseibium salinum]